MGAPVSGMEAAEQPTAEAMLTSLRTIRDSERPKHVAVLDYWLSIRGDKEFPPLHELDPLQISDAAPHSLLLELIGGGQDAEIRHLGDALANDVTVQRIIDASSPSLLASIARKLPIVAISRDFLAFEDNFTAADGPTRCWVTLLPLSSCGSWVDYVYAFVTIEKATGKAALPAETAEPVEDAVEAEAEAVAELPAEEPETEEIVEEPVVEEALASLPAEDLTVEEPAAEDVEAVAETPVEEPAADAEEVIEPEPEPEPEPEVAELVEPEPEPEVAELVEPEPEPELEEAPPAKGPGFSKLFENFATLTGFYNQGIKIDEPAINVEPPAEELAPLELGAVEPEPEPEPEPGPTVEPEVAEQPDPLVDLPAEEPLEQSSPAPVMEGNLQNKLTEVRAKADEAREAQLRATTALHEGLSAAYDFAIDAETAPEEYLRLVEAQGLKIQLRAPMAPVAKLAFDGVCDAATIRQFEAVLAWALKVELPRGALLERIQTAGGVPELLDEFSKAA
ncbi:hypothetical protein LZ518_10105 [Sphingomonas sp. RB56-2]|uniref:Uncharacterized protein n=1 Tax=Sphingomonas brevis TaxID=2908206 RepID=A0ABT0SAQ1_9SPHN|nr:hypothetical protein [Sphingomonas brevis]MCL6741484.1 hypothetical protein [Sphingomonas brevis]